MDADVSIVRSDYMGHPRRASEFRRRHHPVGRGLQEAHQYPSLLLAETADNGPTMKAMLKGVIASLNIEKKKRAATETATAEWYKSLEPKLLKIGAVTLAPSTETDKSSGLTFHYPPYAVGPYAEGEYVAYVPWKP